MYTRRNQAVSSFRKKGITIPEMAASMAFVIPILVLIGCVVYEAAMVYLINSGVDTAARRAARDLVAEYTKDPTIADSRAAQDAKVFNRIEVPNIVNDASQFNAVFDEFPTTGPPTVTVFCVFHSGQHGLPAFPHPDPLQLKRPGFVIGSVASNRLDY